MTSEGHIIFAFGITILAKKMALTPDLAYGDWWHIIPGGLITCLLPDIDHPKSILGQKLTWLSALVYHIFGHRGFTHSLLAIITGILLFNHCQPPESIIPFDAFHAMIIGYFSHIVADMLTPAGVPLLWPCRCRFRLPILIFTKNNKIERLVCIAALIFALQYPTTEPIARYLTMTEYVQALLQRMYVSLCCYLFEYNRPQNG
ncbi:metal-dependent hydrolase [Sodalis endosymbiont of Henestaris halophilus]|uniref:metal-dependent hydrolase n=1 Tax=Sodalis endosymbiont of Henestaris halophilus TaxID=1929246 RepID=UPI000BE3EF03|nr:metal-dependent hydrolase [Sodalis endosymbiont of Henestaris halophilus]